MVVKRTKAEASVHPPDVERGSSDGMKVPLPSTDLGKRPSNAPLDSIQSVSLAISESRKRERKITCCSAQSGAVTYTVIT